jgi:hypothetical protein
MTQSSSISSDERIVDALIELACAAQSHRVIVAGSDSLEVLRELLRRGYSRVTAAKSRGAPCGQNDVALITWREHSTRALATTLDWLVHFLRPAGVLVIWVGPHERMPNQVLRLALKQVGFRIDVGTRCENGVAIAARRLESTPAAKAA